MKPLHIYYAIPDFPQWETMAYPTINEMKASGLWDAAEKITFSIHYNINNFNDIKEKFKDDPKVQFYHNPNAVKGTGEVYCNYKLQQDVLSNNDSYYVLRGHVKGITHINTSQWGGMKAWADNIVKYDITNWRTAISKLDEGYDCTGIHWRGKPWPHGHFAGSWWWTTSEYIRKLAIIKEPHTVNCATQFYPNIPGSSSRHDAESWIGTGEPKAWDMFTESSEFCSDVPDMWDQLYMKYCS